MRAIATWAVVAVVAACAAPDPTRPGAVSPARVAPPGRSAADAPSADARLADDVTPLAYDLTLDVDPARVTFTGRVAITIAVTTPGTRRLWLHAAALELTRATLTVDRRTDAVEVLDGGAQLRGFALPRPVGGPGHTVTLTIDYTGHVRDLTAHPSAPEQGLFRQRADGRWYLYSQAESTFAREIVPCFDEPRWKPAWRVTIVAPAGHLALANAPLRDTRAHGEGRRAHRFAEITGLPSYLLAIAVGPFELVDAGALGRRRVPVRLAVLAGDGARTARALRVLPRIVDELERYLDAPLPLAKLDLVAVPEFFGAMENPGLITFDTAVLIGGYRLTSVVAHELAHQWFGHAVTPAWWDHLWLSEAFATWLSDRVSEALGPRQPPAVAHLTRTEALDADDAVDAAPLVRSVAADNVEPMFDAIAYDKGAAVLAMFERFVGPAAFQAAVRAYLTAHAGRAVTSQAFVDALVGTTRAELGAALASNLAHVGTPVVELAVRCGESPVVVASVRGGATVPVCVRAPPAIRMCFLAGARTEHPLPAAAGCPAWLVGNDGGRGYYHVASQAPAPPLAVLSPEERLARGDDLAAAVRRGERTLTAALAELTPLARSGDPEGELAALALARAIDPLIDEAQRPAWVAWLGDRFAHRLTRRALAAPRSAVDVMLRRQVLELARDAVDPATRAEARAKLLRRLDRDLDASQLLLAAGPDASALFERWVAAAAARRAGELLEALGVFPAAFAPRVVEAVLDPRLPGEQAWPALAAMLARPETATAAWRALHARLDAVLAVLSAGRTRDVITATAGLCDPAARAEVTAAFAPMVAPIVGSGDRAGQRALATTLATIDRCLARRAALGDVAAALAAARRGAPPPRR